MTKQEPTIDLLKSYIRKCEESLESTTDYALLGALVRRIELLRYAIECIEKCIEHEDKIGKIRFICNYEVGSRHEICDKILAVIDGSDNE